MNISISIYPSIGLKRLEDLEERIPRAEMKILEEFVSLVANR
jgi:hypothetical protein